MLPDTDLSRSYEYAHRYGLDNDSIGFRPSMSGPVTRMPVGGAGAYSCITRLARSTTTAFTAITVPPSRVMISDCLTTVVTSDGRPLLRMASFVRGGGGPSAPLLLRDSRAASTHIWSNGTEMPASHGELRRRSISLRD